MKGWRLAVTSPPLLLLALLAVAGLLVFRDYGLTWDEPLFYNYADALGYAYTPANWFSGHFDLNESYGSSGDDHKNRGPAYLLLAREPVHLARWLGLDAPSAWHLVNFLTFVLGIYFVYRLAGLLASPWAAFTAASLLAFQPMLWGHAFINPKDIPFLVFLSGAIWLGLRMVDQLNSSQAASGFSAALRVLVPAIFLGVASSNRVLGPLAGILVLAYFVAMRSSWRLAPWMVAYALLSVAVVILSWPYLWESPLRFLQVFRFMSDNPTTLPVLFAGQVYGADDLPRRYLPFFLLFTVTEVVWPLFLLGMLRTAWPRRSDPRRLVIAALILAWFVIPLAYDLILRPPDYDGMRHFLFILPPLFVFAAVALDFVFSKVRVLLVNVALGVVILAPGIRGMIQLHPYEYAYYNAFVGGTAGAFRHYETDYWLTCYRESLQEFQRAVRTPATLYVHRQAEVARPYAAPSVTVIDQRGSARRIMSGDYILVNTRTNEDLETFREAATILSVGRAGATFCVIKRLP